MEPAVGPSTISGRVAERARLVDLVRDAVEGHPGAVLLHGEAGVGKTALVRSVVEEVRGDGVQVLWGSGLRFDAADALLRPITMALDRWLRDADPTDRGRVLHGLPGVGALLPSIGALIGGAPTRPVVVVDALVSRILELGPTVLVIDDVQWADPASRGALAYLIAGFSRQRLAVVTTHRVEDSRGAEDFQNWFADMRRMPSVSVMALGRLDREATRAQLTSLLGAAPADSLVDQAFERSQGNAYLTELLVSETDASAEVLPDSLPAALTDALLSAWQRLSPTGRSLTRVLAVAGRPTNMGSVREVVLDATGEDALVVALHEAVDAGIVVVDGGTAWFRHPLLADMLMGEFLPGEAASIHAAWAGVLSRTSAAGIDEVRRQSALALHCEAAGDAQAAFAASLMVADLAEEQGSLGDAARNLVRAAALWDDGAPDPDDTSTLVALLERGGTMCNRAEQGSEAHALVARALEVVDERADPLRASRLLMEWADLQWELGLRDVPPIDDVARAVELAGSAPDTPEYAESLAMLSNGLRWSGRHDDAAARGHWVPMRPRARTCTLPTPTSSRP